MTPAQGRQELRRLETLLHTGAVKSTPPEPFLLPGGPAAVCWRRSAKARRVSLRIDATRGQVVVTLPMRTGRAAGMALLTDHAAWVTARLAELPDKAPFEAGASVMIDGEPHPIVHAPASRGGAWIEAGAVHVAGDPAFLARRVHDFLRAEAKKRFGAAALAKAQSAGLAPKRVTVKNTHTRWGSCSPEGVLMFCWRLIMAPSFVQDYVVAHEVAHLRHMNHGADFWALTDQLSPDRTRAVAWLHEEGPRLLRAG